MPKEIRQIRIKGNLAFVPLTQGKEAVIDAVDALYVGQWNWRASRYRNTFYAIRNTSMRDGKVRTVLMHRALMGNPPNHQIDHADENGLNNRRGNLRPATHSENGFNRGPTKSNSSGFKGVHWHKPGKKWQAQIMVGGVSKHLGLFQTAEEAHMAYCRAADELHGEFARFR